MLTLSDSALCADARDHGAITSRPQPHGKQAAAALSNCFLLIILIMYILP